MPQIPDRAAREFSRSYWGTRVISPEPKAEVTDDKSVRKLLGPRGEVLRTFSDRAPIGFR